MASDWRGPSDAAPVARVGRPISGKPKQLHLRASPTSHPQEQLRVKAIAATACDVIDGFAADVRVGGVPRVAELVEVVDAVTATILRDAVALPSVMRLRDQHGHTYMHSVSVCGLMIALATEMQFDAALVRTIGLSGLLHDIGKSIVPSTESHGAADARSAEQARVQDHTEAGYRLLQGIAGTSPLVLDVCRDHHERPDGAGSPRGLTCADISVYVKMCSVCNFYDNATCPPAGAERWSPGHAIEYLRASRGEFDPQIVTRFIRTIGTFLPGVLVRLQSERIGIILDENTDGAMHPVVAVFKDTRNRDLPWHRVSTKSDAILSIERPESWSLDDWPSLRRQLLAMRP